MVLSALVTKAASWLFHHPEGLSSRNGFSSSMGLVLTSQVSALSNGYEQRQLCRGGRRHRWQVWLHDALQPDGVLQGAPVQQEGGAQGGQQVHRGHLLVQVLAAEVQGQVLRLQPQRGQGPHDGVLQGAPLQQGGGAQGGQQVHQGHLLLQVLAAEVKGQAPRPHVQLERGLHDRDLQVVPLHPGGGAGEDLQVHGGHQLLHVSAAGVHGQALQQVQHQGGQHVREGLQAAALQARDAAEQGLPPGQLLPGVGGALVRVQQREQGQDVRLRQGSRNGYISKSSFDPFTCDQDQGKEVEAAGDVTTVSEDLEQQELLCGSAQEGQVTKVICKRLEYLIKCTGGLSINGITIECYNSFLNLALTSATMGERKRVAGFGTNVPRVCARRKDPGEGAALTLLPSSERVSACNRRGRDRSAPPEGASLNNRILPLNMFRAIMIEHYRQQKQFSEEPNPSRDSRQVVTQALVTKGSSSGLRARGARSRAAPRHLKPFLLLSLFSPLE